MVQDKTDWKEYERVLDTMMPKSGVKRSLEMLAARHQITTATQRTGDRFVKVSLREARLAMDSHCVECNQLLNEAIHAGKSGVWFDSEEFHLENPNMID